MNGVFHLFGTKLTGSYSLKLRAVEGLIESDHVIVPYTLTKLPTPFFAHPVPGINESHLYKGLDRGFYHFSSDNSEKDEKAELQRDKGI